jgi:hypothetical protein
VSRALTGCQVQRLYTWARAEGKVGALYSQGYRHSTVAARLQQLQRMLDLPAMWCRVGRCQQGCFR